VEGAVAGNISVELGRFHSVFCDIPTAWLELLGLTLKTLLLAIKVSIF